MDEVTVELRRATVEEFIEMRRSAGWSIPDADVAAVALANSLFAACALKDGRCVGIAESPVMARLLFTLRT